MPKVSIIIPIYNVEKYLRQCLDSIVNQTLKDIEIICVDDGSPDNCGHIIDEYASKDERIVAVHKENGGYASAINYGLDIVKGEFVGIVESDDFIKPSMYKDLYNEIKDTDADYIISDFYYYTNKKYKPASIIGIEDFKSYYNIDNTPSLARIVGYPWNNLYRKSFLNNNMIRMLDDGKGAYEDQPWKATLLSKAKKIIYLNKPLYCYRYDSEMSSTNNGSRKLINHITRREQVRQIYINNNVFNSEVMEYYYVAAILGHMRFFKNISKKYKEEYFNKMKEKLTLAIDVDGLTFKYFTKEQKEIFNIILKKNYNEFVKWNMWQNFKKNVLGICITETHIKIAILGIKISIKLKPQTLAGVEKE